MKGVMAKSPRRKSSPKQKSERAPKLAVRLDDKSFIAVVPRRKKTEDLRGRSAWFQGSAGVRPKI